MILVGAIALWLAMVLAGWTMIASAAAVRTARADLALSGYRALIATGIAIVCGVAGVVRAVAIGEFRMIEVQLVAGRSELPTVQTALLMSASWWWMLVLLLIAMGAAFAERPSARLGEERLSAGRVGVAGAALLVGLMASRQWFDPYLVGVASAAALGVLDEPRGLTWAMHRLMTAGSVALVVLCGAAAGARVLMRRAAAPPATVMVMAWIASTLALVAGWAFRALVVAHRAGELGCGDGVAHPAACACRARRTALACVAMEWCDGRSARHDRPGSGAYGADRVAGIGSTTYVRPVRDIVDLDQSGRVVLCARRGGVTAAGDCVAAWVHT
jgi:hypothetical protein